MAEREVHLRDYLAIIRKHDFIIIVSFLLIFGTALTVSLYMPRIYEATATIEIAPSAKPSGLPSLMQSVMSSGVDQVSMETVCRRFTSRPILAETIRNLKRAIPEMVTGPQVPEALEPRIRTDTIPDTRMIELTIRMRRDEGGTEYAVRVANELISVMQIHRGAKNDAKVDKRQGFIADKMRETEGQIEDSDQSIRQFLRDGGNPLIWSVQSNHLMERLSDLIKLRERNKILITAEKKKFDELKIRLADEPEWVESSRTFTRDVLLDKYRTELVDLRKELAAISISSKENNPKVKSLNASINEIEKAMRNMAQEAVSPSSKTESRNPTYQTIMSQVIESELNLIAYRAQREVTEEVISKLDDEMQQIFSEMPEKQFQLDKMSREVEYKIEAYKSLLNKKIEAELWASESSDDTYGNMKGGIEIIDTARPMGTPVSPRTKFIGAIGVLVGLVVGLGLAFLAEYFENTYQSPEEARDDLGIPLLGTIPFIKGQQTGGAMLPVVESTKSVEAESFRTLLANIEFSSPEKPYESLLVTSSGAGEGKSLAAANLAAALAQARSGSEDASARQVVLVDCDMRKAVQHKIFGADNQVGLTNLLVGSAELESVIQDTNIPNLSLITCGPTPSNPVELLKSQRIGEILANLKESFELVLCDSPPVLPVADALILASRVDGVVFLADLSRTPREVLRQAKDQLSKLDVPLLGLICNRMGTAKYSSYYH